MVLNLGTSFYIFFGSIFLLPLIKKFGFYIDRRYGDDYPRLQKYYLKLKSSLEYGYFIRLMFEMYLDLAITSFVNLYFLEESLNTIHLSGNLVSLVLAIIGSIIVVVVPLKAFSVLQDYRRYIESDEF